MKERRGHYIPSNAAQFEAWFENVVRKVKQMSTGSGAPWTHIPAGRVIALEATYSAFSLAFLAALNTPTHANILRRQEAQKEATAEIRAFVNQYLRFPPVTNVDRADMGIPNHDAVRTDHKVVAEGVDFVIHLEDIRELVVQFWIKGAAHRAKPEGYDGAVIIWGLRDAPPERPEDLERHAMASRTPFTLRFEEVERGRTCYVALCWQNERGILGEWSEYKSAVVP